MRGLLYILQLRAVWRTSPFRSAALRTQSCSYKALLQVGAGRGIHGRSHGPTMPAGRPGGWRVIVFLLRSCKWLLICSSSIVLCTVDDSPSVAADRARLHVSYPASFAAVKRQIVADPQRAAWIDGSFMIPPRWVVSTVKSSAIANALPFTGPTTEVTHALLALEVRTGRASLLSSLDPSWRLDRAFPIGDAACGVVLRGTDGEVDLASWEVATNRVRHVGAWAGVDAIARLVDLEKISIAWFPPSEPDSSPKSVFLGSTCGFPRVSLPVPPAEPPRFPYEFRAGYNAGRNWYGPVAGGQGVLLFEGQSEFRSRDDAYPRYRLGSPLRVLSPLGTGWCRTLRELGCGQIEAPRSVMPIYSPWCRGAHVVIELVDDEGIAWINLQPRTAHSVCMGKLGQNSVWQAAGHVNRLNWPACSVDGRTLAYPSVRPGGGIQIVTMDATEPQVRTIIPSNDLPFEDGFDCIAITPGGEVILQGEAVLYGASLKEPNGGTIHLLSDFFAK